MFNRVPSDRTKVDSEMKPMAPTSRPTIGNTIVGGSFLVSFNFIALNF